MHRNRKDKKTRRKPSIRFFVVNMASGMARGRKYGVAQDGGHWLSFVLLQDELSFSDSVKVESFCQPVKTITNVNHQLAWKTRKYPLYHDVLFKLWHQLLSRELCNNQEIIAASSLIC